MHIQIGNAQNPVNLKVTGGFKVESPIVKINSVRQTIDVYGDEDEQFVPENVSTAAANPNTELGIIFYKSHEDFLVGEQSIQITGAPQAIQYVQVETLSLTLMYAALAEKLKDFFAIVTVVE